MKGVAKFSDDRKYRYVLGRVWGKPKPGQGWMTFVMLNPSTASATRNDPTIRRCISFSRREGYEGILVVNLYGVRATDPHDLKAWGEEAVGPDNDYWLDWANRRAELLVLAWGNSVAKVPGSKERIERVLEVLDYPFAAHPVCLGRTKSGQPRHPLMLRADTEFEDY